MKPDFVFDGAQEILEQCLPNCVPWKICRCAAGFFKILNFYSCFQPKLRKYCYEVMVDNSGDRVVLPEKVVISKKIESHLSRCHL